jgi:hypothetical protein
MKETDHLLGLLITSILNSDQTRFLRLAYWLYFTSIGSLISLALRRFSVIKNESLKLFSSPGKSNVMDALSFVMGEKTTNLRVKNIQELIHGAHTGKPVSSSASVTIIYIEDSGEEKTFTRIIRGRERGVCVCVNYSSGSDRLLTL